MASTKINTVYRVAFPVVIAIVVVLAFLFYISHQGNDYLYKPTGQYHVGVKTYHWTNTDLCPDPVAPQDSTYDSSDNGNCHALMLQVFYPTSDTRNLSMSESPFVQNAVKQSLLQVQPSGLQTEVKQQISDLSQLKVMAAENLPMMSGKFPTILFSPGEGDNSEEYENLLINLASQGYIVIGVNSAYTAPMILKGGKILPQNQAMFAPEKLETLYQVKYQDLEYVYQEMKREVALRNPFFQHVNFEHIGLLGHGAGGSAVIAMAREYPKQIKAVVALDAPNQTDSTVNPTLAKANIVFPDQFNVFKGTRIPMLQMHSSYAANFLGAPDVELKLSANNYLVTIMTPAHDPNYFKHMDFTDYVLFKDLSLMQEIDQYYQSQGIENPIFPSWEFGSISGQEAMQTLSAYLDGFFGFYLQNQNRQDFQFCTALTDDTILKCGTR